MRAHLCFVVLVGACGEDGAADPPNDVEETDDPIKESSTDSGTSPPGDLACYAYWESDFDDDGTIEGLGYDQYDPVRTHLLIHSERHYDLGLSWTADYEYDAAGNLILSTQDTAGDGFVDYVVLYAYDDANNLVRYEIDDDADGTPEVVHNYGYDAAGNLVEADFDYDGNGAVDFAIQYVRDAEGRRISATEDQEGDGQTDRWITYSYDAVWREIEIAADDGNDGTIDYLYTVTYIDPILLTGTAVTDRNNDGGPEEIDIFESDGENRLLFHEEDRGADGFVDLIESFEYDPVSGLLVTEDTEEHVFYHDETYVEHSEWRYDELLRTVDLFEEYWWAEVGDETSSSARQTWTFAGTCP